MGWWVGSLGAGVLGHTICITGDGSFHMNVQELATIKRNQLPIKIFVWNNHGYGLIKATQNRFMEGRHIGIDKDTGLEFPNLEKIANAYGIKYYKIDELLMYHTHKNIIKAVLEETQPVLCEVEIQCSTLLRPADYFTARSASSKGR